MKKLYLLLSILFLSSLACDLLTGEPSTREIISTPTEQISITPLTNPPLPSEVANNKWALWQDGLRLRGANLHPCRVYGDGECTEPITKADIADLRALNANLIHATYPGPFNVQPPYDLNEAALADLDNLVQWAEEVDIFVVIAFRSGPGRNESAIHLLPDADYGIWQEQAAHEAWIEQWRFTAERYKDNPAVIGYTLLTEPHPNTLIDPDYELSPQELQSEIENGLLDWNRFAAEITVAIRSVDPVTPIIINSIGWAAADYFSILQPTGDPYTIYSVHAYDPDVYSHQEADALEIQYPSVVHYEGKEVHFNRDWLVNSLAPVVEFAEMYQTPIFVGEHGPMRWVPGGEEYLADQMTIFEAYGWPYAYYVWRGDEVYFDGFNLAYGPDPENHTALASSPLLNEIMPQWKKNIDFPSTLNTP